MEINEIQNIEVLIISIQTICILFLGIGFLWERRIRKMYFQMLIKLTRDLSDTPPSKKSPKCKYRWSREVKYIVWICLCCIVMIIGMSLSLSGFNQQNSTHIVWGNLCIFIGSMFLSMRNYIKNNPDENI